MKHIRLTEYSRGAGCGCKIAPAALREIIADDSMLPSFPGLLVGNESSDDAAVIDIGADELLISTTDFFMPVVDDPADFGKIAAANALSDVYAMGGRPILAVAILGWPVEKLGADIAREVLNGARFMCRIAGIPLAGGHSIDSQEPFFGLAVNGLVPRSHLKRNNTAKAGDLIYITKPIGFGIITTAAKRGPIPGEHLEEAVRFMTSLNSIGAVLGGVDGVHAMTDTTGFGLLGHLLEMCEGAGLSAELRAEAVPTLSCIQPYVSGMIYPDMTMKNFNALSPHVSPLTLPQLLTLCDPQTSGGLMVAVDPAASAQFEQTCRDFGLTGIADRPIGQFVEKREKAIEVN